MLFSELTLRRNFSRRFSGDFANPPPVLRQVAGAAPGGAAARRGGQDPGAGPRGSSCTEESGGWREDEGKEKEEEGEGRDEPQKRNQDGGYGLFRSRCRSWAVLYRSRATTLTLHRLGSV